LSSSRKRHTAEEIREDLREFFENSDHWAYQYGDPTPECGPGVPYHRKQIEVIFEEEYDHWDVNNQVDNLIHEGFLRLIKGDIAQFVLRRDIRYYRNNIKKRIKLINTYSDDIITKALGKQAEHLSEIMFLLNGFIIADRNTNKYKGKV